MKNVILFVFMASLSLSLFGCATTTAPDGGFIPDTYTNTKFTMIQGTGDNRILQDAVIEPLVYPFVQVVNFATLRLFWDHGDYPMSGFVNSMLDVFAVLPLYSHTDIRFKKLYGLGSTNTEVLHEEQHFTPPPTPAYPR